MPYSLRDSENKLVVPHPRTNYMKNIFSYSGATLWNSLSCNLRMIKSLNQFKSKLDTAFMENRISLMDLLLQYFIN